MLNYALYKTEAQRNKEKQFIMQNVVLLNIIANHIIAKTILVQKQWWP